MKYCQLLNEDRIRLLPPQEDGEGAVEILCERVLCIFPLDQLREVCLLKAFGQDMLCFRAPDALFAREHLVQLPLSHPDCAAFLSALQEALPACFPLKERPAGPLCDQNGHHIDE